MYIPLAKLCEGRWDQAFAELPVSLQQGIDRAFFLVHWDRLEPDARRQLVLQADLYGDPKRAGERAEIWTRLGELEEAELELDRLRKEIKPLQDAMRHLSSSIKRVKRGLKTLKITRALRDRQLFERVRDLEGQGERPEYKRLGREFGVSPGTAQNIVGRQRAANGTSKPRRKPKQQ